MGWLFGSSKKPEEKKQETDSKKQETDVKKLETKVDAKNDQNNQEKNIVAEKNPITDKKVNDDAKKELPEIDPTEKLIRVAATFQTNPKIENESYELKRTFLKRKGLNDEMIKKAFDLYKEKIRMQQEEKEQKEAITDPNSDTSEAGINNRIEKAKKTKFLSLRKCNLTNIPEKVFSELPELEILIISGNNQLESIPDDIKNLIKLKNFQAVGCNLTQDAISDEFFKLESLEHLNLSRNAFTNIDKIVGLKKLTMLDVSHNELMNLPEEIGDLEELKLQNARSNNLSMLPSSLKNIAKLKVQNLVENNLDDDLIKAIHLSGTKCLPEFI